MHLPLKQVQVELDRLFDYYRRNYEGSITELFPNLSTILTFPTPDRFVLQDCFTYDELSDEAKEKVLNKLHDINVDYEWWDYDPEVLLGFTQDELDAADLAGGSSCEWNYDKFYFDLDRNWHIEFVNLTVGNEEVFYQWLGIPKYLHEYLDCIFFSSGHRHKDTRCRFEWDDDGYLDEYFDPTKTAIIEVDSKTHDDERERIDKILSNAEDTVNEKIQNVIQILQDNFDYLTGEKGIKETIEANEYTFNSEGEIC